MEKGKTINRYMTVGELNYNISLYRTKGDLSARDRLFEAYKPMVDKIVANIVETDATVEKEKEDLLQDGYCSLLTYFKEGYIDLDGRVNNVALCIKLQKDIYQKAYPYLVKNKYASSMNWSTTMDIVNGGSVSYHSLLEKVKTRTRKGVSKEKERVLLKYNVANPELVEDEGIFEKSEDNLFFNEIYESMIRDVELLELSEKLDYILSTLTEREEDVLRLRFGLEPKHIKIDPGNDKVCDFKDVYRTLEEVSKYFNVSKDRVRQIECKALYKLRHRSRARHLKYFLTEED